MRSRSRLLPSIAATAALAVVLAGCGAGSGSSGAAAGSTAIPVPVPVKDAALAAMVPASVSADGKIVFGSDASYAPNEFTAPDGTTIIGLDVDLGTAVAEKLGLKAEFQNSQFDGIIPGINGKRYELGMSSFTINDDRVKTVDMVSYFSAGTSLAVAKGNPVGITGADALCGRAVGVQTGTVQAADIATRNTACTAAGKPAIAVTQLQAQSDVTLALASKRIVAMLADSPVVAYAVTTTEGALEVIGTPYDTAPYGIVLAKSQGDYGKAVQGALQSLIGDGTYGAILKKWNVSAGAIPTSEVKS